MPRLLSPPGGPRLHEIQTEWAMLARLGDPSDADRRASWDRLLAVYQPAMRAYVERTLARYLGARAPHFTDDTLQEFLAACLTKGWLSRADPGMGKFRQFLQTLLKRFATKAALKVLRAEKRLEGAVPVEEVEGGRDEPATPDEDVEAFDRAWVGTTLAEARARLRVQHPRYADVVDRLLEATERGEDARPEALGIPRHLLHRARKALQRHFAEVLRPTVVLDGQVAEEWAAIARFLP